MSLSALIQLVSSCVGIVGSLFFAIGIMRQSVEAMARLSGTYWDWNPHVPIALGAQKADYVFGGGLILLAFALQLGSFFAPASLQVLDPSQARIAPWIAVAATVASFLVLRLASRLLAKRYADEISSWLRKELDEDEARKKSKKGGEDGKT